MTAQNLIDNI